MDQTYKLNAVKSIRSAEYLLSTSYKEFKEPKALLVVADHVLDAFISCVSVLLERDRELRKIPPYHDNYESKLRSFSNYVSSKYALDEYSRIMERIMLFSAERKKAPIEFGRKGSYIVCSDQFSKISTITEEDAKQYIKKAKEFIPLMENILNERAI